MHYKHSIVHSISLFLTCLLWRVSHTVKCDRTIIHCFWLDFIIFFFLRCVTPDAALRIKIPSSRLRAVSLYVCRTLLAPTTAGLAGWLVGLLMQREHEKRSLFIHYSSFSLPLLSFFPLVVVSHTPRFTSHDCLRFVNNGNLLWWSQVATSHAIIMRFGSQREQKWNNSVWGWRLNIYSCRLTHLRGGGPMKE